VGREEAQATEAKEEEDASTTKRPCQVM
jgi:hypothetical protein